MNCTALTLIKLMPNLPSGAGGIRMPDPEYCRHELTKAAVCQH